MATSILIIEDDPLVSRMYQKSFDFEGFETTIASDGREGLDKAAKIRPDAILLDIMMPKMNGMEVLEDIKADEELKTIPVIILTNLSGTQDAENALKRGALAYLVKSEYKPKEVVARVKQILAGQKAPAQPAIDQAASLTK